MFSCPLSSNSSGRQLVALVWRGWFKHCAHFTEDKLRPGEDRALTLKIYMLCTTTGIWRPRLLAKAWKGVEVTQPACPHSSQTNPGSQEALLWGGWSRQGSRELTRQRGLPGPC